MAELIINRKEIGIFFAVGIEDVACVQTITKLEFRLREGYEDVMMSIKKNISYFIYLKEK